MKEELIEFINQKTKLNVSDIYLYDEYTYVEFTIPKGLNDLERIEEHRKLNKVIDSIDSSKLMTYEN